MPHEMRKGMADDRDALLVLISDDSEGRVFGDLDTSVRQAIVDLARERCLGEPRAYGLGHLHHGDRMVKMLRGTVWKGDYRHKSDMNCIGAIGFEPTTPTMSR